MTSRVAEGARTVLGNRAMLVRRLLLATVLVITACADEDPRFGPPGAGQYIQVFDAPPTPVLEGGANLSARQLFAQVWTALNVPCGGCHRPEGMPTAPKFFGADEESSYAAFKSFNYHVEGGKRAGSTYGLVERGAHATRALTAAEISLITQWRAAEKSSPTDAGNDG